MRRIAPGGARGGYGRFQRRPYRAPAVAQRVSRGDRGGAEARRRGGAEARRRGGAENGNGFRVETHALASIPLDPRLQKTILGLASTRRWRRDLAGSSAPPRPPRAPREPRAGRT